MAKLSAVHRGTAFEQLSLRLLQAHLSMTLRRVGGRSDGGIDLIGWWWLPFSTESNPIHCSGAFRDPDGLWRRRLRVIAQCKAEKKKFTPKYVREMEGVWHLQSRSFSSLAASSLSPTTSPPPLVYESTSPDAYPTVAVLLSESPFSQLTVLHVYRSTVPFLLIHIPCSAPWFESSSTSSSVGDTEMGTVCPNPTLSHLVKPLAFRWERNLSAGLSTETNMYLGGRPGLWWQGRRLGSWVPEVPGSDTT